MSRADRLWASSIFAGLAALFWAGRSRSFGMGDSPQHVLCALTWSVPHPPGYPLQTALGWLWSRLPWADPGSAVNGLSGILAAGAAATLFLFLRRAGARRAAAAAGACMMALSPLFWYYSLVAEVRALNALLALGAAFFAAGWAREGGDRRLLAFGLLFGLGLSHHPTYLFLVPAFAVWLSARRPSPRAAAGALAAAALGLAGPYLLLGLRLSLGAPPVYDLFEVRGWSGLWPLLTRARLGGPLRLAAGAPALGTAGFDFAALARHAGWLLSSLWAHAGPAVLTLAAFGAVSLWKGARRELAAWASWAAASAGLYLVFSSQQMPSIDEQYARAVAARFHLLPMIAVFALAAHGAEALATRVRPALMGALLAAVVLGPLVLRPLSLAGQNPLLDYVRALARDSAPGDMIVLGGDDTIFGTLDLQLARGEAPGRVFLAPSMLAFPPYLRRLRAAHPELVFGTGTDWARWKKLNRGNAVLIEPSLIHDVLRDFPSSVPQGTLIRVESSPVRSDPAAEALRFLDAPETSSFTRRQARPWTQEVYLLQARGSMAQWLASRLDPSRDAALLARLALLKDQL